MDSRDARDDEGLWTHHLIGETYRGLGPPHGLVGNVRILLDGPLDEEAKQGLRRKTNELLARYAVLADDHANWPGAARAELPGADGEIRLQWCTGAPGTVACAWDYPVVDTP